MSRRDADREPDPPEPASLEAAADAIRTGTLVVYPTETVYGLAGDALESPAIESVFEAKGRERDNPLSLAVPTVEAARAYVDLDDSERAFGAEFLPGPVTLIAAKRDVVPDVLTGGRERVGVRVPDHPTARQLLECVAPITATSANVSGSASATRLEDVDERILRTASARLDGGETAGVESTVVDVESGEIHRRGARAGDVAAWLREQ